MFFRQLLQKRDSPRRLQYRSHTASAIEALECRRLLTLVARTNWKLSDVPTAAIGGRPVSTGIRARSPKATRSSRSGILEQIGPTCSPATSMATASMISSDGIRLPVSGGRVFPMGRDRRRCSQGRGRTSQRGPMWPSSICRTRPSSPSKVRRRRIRRRILIKTSSVERATAHGGPHSRTAMAHFGMSF